MRALKEKKNREECGPAAVVAPSHYLSLCLAVWVHGYTAAHQVLIIETCTNKHTHRQTRTRK